MPTNHSAYRNIKLCLIGVLCTMAVAGFPQKGTGDNTGMSQQQLNPELLKMEGVIEKIEIAPCKYTTGKSTSGTHFMVRTDDKLINVHLGPTAEVSKLISATENDPITLTLFQTGRLPEDEYIAKEVIVNGKNTVLRDENLKPVWAGSHSKEKWRKAK